MRVLAFGTYDVNMHPRVAVLVEGLRAHGMDVSELNLPLGVDTATRVSMLQSPWRAGALGTTVMRRWAVLRRRSRELSESPDVVLVGYLGHFDVHLARRLFPSSVIVLDHLVSGAGTAVDRGESSAVKLRMLRRLDAAATTAADVIIVDTDEHRAALPAQDRERSVVVPVGASHEWFDAGSGSKPSDRELSMIFFGLFTPLQGAPVIAKAFRELAESAIADVRLTMVGRGQDWNECRAILGNRPEVRWHDWVSAEELPSLVAAHDVCFGIFGTGRKALDVVPTKVYQGSAAGCALVTSDTSPQRRTLGDAALMAPPGDVDTLTTKLRSLAENPAMVRWYQESARAVARAAFTPAAVTTELVESLTRQIQGRDLG